MRYERLFLSDDQLKKNIHLQVMARCRPKRLTIPDGWIPRSQIDRFVWRNLVKDWPLAKLMKVYPMLTVNFINKNLFGLGK